MIAKIYQSGEYCESVPFGSYHLSEQGILLYSDDDLKNPKAFVPHSMMIIFDNSGLPDYDKMGKDLREKKL